METRAYASWTEYLAALALLPQHQRAGGREWTGGAPTVAEALDLAGRGWPEGMALIRSTSLPVAAALLETDHAVDWGWDVTGADYDVGEYLAGTPECWLAPVASTSRPCLTLSVHTGSQGDVPTEAIKLRGAAMVSLAMALQGAGYAIRVYAIDWGNVEGGADSLTRVTLSDDAGGPLDVDRLLFALAHPAATRTLAYSHRVSLSKYAGQPVDSLGIHHPHAGPKPDLPPEWKTDLHLSRLMPTDADWRNADSIERWVRATFASLTGASA